MSAAPVLTKTSAAGHNPMSWDGTYTGLQVGDTIRLSWAVNGGAATTETHTVTSDDLLVASTGSLNLPWPAFAAASAGFAGGSIIAVKEWIERGAAKSPDSNTISDTTALAVSSILRRAESIRPGYGGGPFSPASPITIASGDKVLVTIFSYGVSSPVIASLTANSGAIAFTKIGTPAAGDGNFSAVSFYADTSGVTSLDLVATASAGAFAEVLFLVTSIRDAAAGGPASSYYERRSLAGTGPYDVDGGLSPPTNGQVILGMGVPNAPYSFTGATEYAGAEVGTDIKCSQAFATAAGNVILSGPDYAPLFICNTTWGP